MVLMAAQSKARKARVQTAIPPPIVVPDVRELKAFYDGAGQLPDFSYARFYWPPGDGPRESILPRITKKRQPAAKAGDCDTAARVEALVPSDAPEDYVDPDFLASRYEETLPEDETTAFAQVTLRFPINIPNLHHPYEVARLWLRNFYLEDKRVPVVAILHAPWRVGSENPVHLHAIAFPRTLGRFGWLAADREVASDAGAKEAFESWQAFKADRL
jgi:hypothetical protein